MLSSNAQSVCAAFHLGNFVSAQNAGGTRNRNYIFITSSGRWFVRQRFAGYSSPQQMEFDHAALTFLNHHGAAVTKSRASQTGETWWKNGDDIWEVFPFIEGRSLRDGNSEDVIALGEALARFHSAGKSFPLRIEKVSPRGETAPSFLRERLIRIQKESPETTSVINAYRKTVDENANLLTDQIYNDLPHTLVHGDVQPANLLLHKSTFAAFVDLDWCAWRVRIYDLSFAILACCAHHKSTFDGSDIWSLTQTPYFENDVVEQFLLTYQNHGEPLNAAEKSALQSQVLLTWCHIRLGGALKVEPERRLEFLSREPRLDKEVPIKPIDFGCVL